MAAQGRAEDEGGGPVIGPGKAFLLVIAALGAAAIFNAEQLLKEAEGKPFGRDRDFWVSVWSPVESISDTLLLTTPRDTIDFVTGRGDEPSVSPLLQLPASEAFETTEFALAVEESPSAPSVTVPAPQESEVLVGIELPGAPPPPLIRTPTPTEPLRIWVGGDSLSVRLAQSLGRDGLATGVMDVQMFWEVSTGLARPDVFDWGAVLTSVDESWSPDVYVIVLGGNDTQRIVDPQGAELEPLTDAWRAEYGRRTAAMMDRFGEEGRLVVWVGLPPVRDAQLSEKFADINAVVRAEAEARERVVFVDSWEVMSDPGGGYTAYLADGGGNMQLVREPDGIHVTRAGGDRLSAVVLDVIEEEASLGENQTPEP